VQAAPAWVTYASLAVAVLAILIAAASLCVALLKYRSDLPRPKLSVAWDKLPQYPDDRPLHVKVRTRGGSELEVVRILITLPRRLSFWNAVVEREHLYAGALPVRVPGRSRVEWSISPRLAIEAHLADHDYPVGVIDWLVGWRRSACVLVVLGDGRILNSGKLRVLKPLLGGNAV
jgi:hypothetical protein